MSWKENMRLTTRRPMSKERPKSHTLDGVSMVKVITIFKMYIKVRILKVCHSYTMSGHWWTEMGGRRLCCDTYTILILSINSIMFWLHPDIHIQYIHTYEHVSYHTTAPLVHTLLSRSLTAPLGPSWISSP